MPKSNSGQSDARNEGLKIAKGDYIGFVDSDDWVDLNYFEELYSYATVNNLDMVVCNRHAYGDNGILFQTAFASYKHYNISSVENYFYENFFKYTPVCYNKIYTKAIIENIKFEPIIQVGSEDALFNFQVMLKLKR